MKLPALVSLAVLSACACAPATAKVVTYDFTAVVYQVREFNAWTGLGQDVVSSVLPGEPVAPGQTISGRLSYSTDVLPWTTYTPSYQPGTVARYAGPVLAEMRIDGTGISYRSTPLNGMGADLTDAPPGAGEDLLTFNTSTGDWPAPNQGLAFVFGDVGGQAVGGASLADLPDLNAFGYAYALYSFIRAEDGAGMSAQAGFTSLTRVAEVPEPSGALLGLTGLGVLALLRRRAVRCAA